MTPEVSKARVLIVDDSVVMRRMLTTILQEEPAIEVLGTARNGQQGVEFVTKLNPSIVIMDVEMPVLDGLGAVRAIRATHPRLPIIMFSALTTSGGKATLDALHAGATDYIAKPAGMNNAAASIEAIRAQLVPKVLGLCDAVDDTAPTHPTSVAPGIVLPSVRNTAKPTRIDAIAIGVSTGGPKALAEVLPRLTIDLALPVFVVQHMPATFTKLLADRLDAQCALDVVEATHGQFVEPGTVYIAPGGHHMTVAHQEQRRHIIALNDEPPENSCRPAVDVLFRSVAREYGANLLAVVLTGMGHDGLAGTEAIVQGGGAAFAQDQATSVVWGMPGAITNAALADKVLPLGDIAPEIMSYVATRFGLRASSRVH